MSTYSTQQVRDEGRDGSRNLRVSIAEESKNEGNGSRQQGVGLGANLFWRLGHLSELDEISAVRLQHTRKCGTEKHKIVVILCLACCRLQGIQHRGNVEHLEHLQFLGRIPHALGGQDAEDVGSHGAQRCNLLLLKNLVVEAESIGCERDREVDPG